MAETFELCGDSFDIPAVFKLTDIFMTLSHYFRFARVCYYLCYIHMLCNYGVVLVVIEERCMYKVCIVWETIHYNVELQVDLLGSSVLLRLSFRSESCLVFCKEVWQSCVYV